MDELEYLLWSWGEAYAVSNPETGLWLAQRRDDRTLLRAVSPEALLEMIRADYAAKPVSRPD